MEELPCFKCPHFNSSAFLGFCRFACAMEELCLPKCSPCRFACAHADRSVTGGTTVIDHRQAMHPRRHGSAQADAGSALPHSSHTSNVIHQCFLRAFLASSFAFFLASRRFKLSFPRNLFNLSRLQYTGTCAPCPRNWSL